MTMTGFGAATPEVTAQPQQAQAQPATVTQANAPGVVSAFEGSIDERLQALMNS
jgi:hypothetical protein